MRKKLIELLKSDMNILKAAGTSATATLRLADNLIDNGVTIQKWIPVTERLPEDDLPEDSKRREIRCFVATNKGSVKTCVRMRHITKRNGGWCYTAWVWSKDDFAKPTHWMPLPQAPKGE